MIWTKVLGKVSNTLAYFPGAPRWMFLKSRRNLKEMRSELAFACVTRWGKPGKIVGRRIDRNKRERDAHTRKTP